MSDTVATLSTNELEALIARVIDERMQFWLERILDALSDWEAEEKEEFREDFTLLLERSIEQAKSGDHISLSAFREQLLK